MLRADLNGIGAHFFRLLYFPMTQIRQAVEADFPAVRELFWEHLQSANHGANQMLQVNFDIVAMLEQDMKDIQKFMPPAGRLFLTFENTKAVGCACTRKIGVGVAELKRMYVRVDQRRKGLGRALVQALIADLREAGFTLFQLESAKFQQEAHALYRSFGFQEIDPYPENEIPENFRKHWIFMELRL